MSDAVKTVGRVDYAVIALYMLLMLGVGVYAARFNRGAGDYFKGGGRVHWLAAGLSSFMSGFSAWTFTGAAGIAYQKGLLAVLLYVGNALTFLLGYWVFAARWRRARLTTVMEYLVDRYDERTRQAFSWVTIGFQLFTGAAMLYGLGLFVAPTCGWPLGWTVVGSGLVILAYTVVGGLWAVILTDFLQAAILLPFTLVLAAASLARVGGLAALAEGLPPAMTSASLPEGFSWSYVLAWTMTTSFGYNTSAMAQRYFIVEDERAARRVAALCFGLFLLGAFVWFLPPLAMRVLYPDLRSALPGLKNPHESVYALASLTLLPPGLVGIMLAAMFSATMSSLSGLWNVHASIIAKDILPAAFKASARRAESLSTGWLATLAVGATMTAFAWVMARRGQSVFQTMLTFNTVLSLAYGPPALLGLVVRRTPSWSGLATFALALLVGSYGAFVATPAWGLTRQVAIVVPAAAAAFLLSALARHDAPAAAARREAFFLRLDTPIDVAAELGDVPDPTHEVFRFLGRTLAAVGALSLLLLAFVAAGERATVVGYAGLTLALGTGLARLGAAARKPAAPPRPGLPD
jgi:solute:Na+ symporter, SSS family